MSLRFAKRIKKKNELLVRDEHGSGLDRTGSGLKPILADQDWIGLHLF